MTDTEIYENNLRHFQVIRRRGDAAQCRCPSHPDKQASLTISKGRKCTLFRCHADISDFFSAGHTVKEFEEMIKGTMLQTKRTAAAVGSPKYILEQLNALRVAERFQMNDRGSADLFATIFKNVSRYNPTKKDWMYYDKTRWTADTEGIAVKYAHVLNEPEVEKPEL